VSYPDLGNVQGIVEHRFAQTHSAVLLFNLSEASDAKRFLGSWKHAVASAGTAPAELKAPLLSFGVTWRGLIILLKNDPTLNPSAGTLELDLAFTERPPDHPGLSDQLGFVGPSAPALWWSQQFLSADIHLAVFVSCDNASQMDETFFAIRTDADKFGLIELRLDAFARAAMSGERPEGGILHFGYRDGITSPEIDWKDAGIPRGVDFREFVMGYPNDSHVVNPVSPGPWREFATDATFACVAWIHQDVAGFNRHLADNASLGTDIAPTGREKEWLAAKMMGRWPDGSPVVRHPDTPPGQTDFDNNFDFHDDPDGIRCPLTAHIRVVNPRGDQLTFPNISRFPAGPPRFIRRGFTYGTKLEGTEDDGAERGLVGIFMCARINEQFYTALRWINQTSFSEALHRKPYSENMQDALFGSRSKPKVDRRLVIPADNGTVAEATLPSFITYRGVCNFMMPGIKSLMKLME
jgi:deferrochelatase/peroxidase EfeB